MKPWWKGVARAKGEPSTFWSSSESWNKWGTNYFSLYKINCIGIHQDNTTLSLLRVKTTVYGGQRRESTNEDEIKIKADHEPLAGCTVPL